MGLSSFVFVLSLYFIYGFIYLFIYFIFLGGFTGNQKENRCHLWGLPTLTHADDTALGFHVGNLEQA